jgi:hypothetical protein
VRHRCWSVGIGHGAYPVESRLIALGDSFVLAEMLVPRGDDELLENPTLLISIAPDPPRARPSAPSTQPRVLQRQDQIILESWAMVTEQVRPKPENRSAYVTYPPSTSS